MVVSGTCFDIWDTTAPIFLKKLSILLVVRLLSGWIFPFRRQMPPYKMIESL